MPAKSRRGKGKHPHLSKKKKAMIRQVSTPLQQQAATVAPKPAVSVKAPAAPKPDATPEVATAIRYPYVAEELKRIGILAGIVIVILIVLSIVL
jgi:hypothetical protein